MFPLSNEAGGSVLRLVTTLKSTDQAESTGAATSWLVPMPSTGNELKLLSGQRLNRIGECHQSFQPTLKMKVCMRVQKGAQNGW